MTTSMQIDKPFFDETVFSESEKQIWLAGYEKGARDAFLKAAKTEQPVELSQIERGAVEHLVKREIPRLLLSIAECVDGEGCEMLIEREHYRDIEFALTDAMKQLDTFMVATKAPKRESVGQYGYAIYDEDELRVMDYRIHAYWHKSIALDKCPKNFRVQRVLITPVSEIEDGGSDA